MTASSSSSICIFNCLNTPNTINNTPYNTMSHQATNIGNLGPPIGGGSTHSHSATGEHDNAGLTGGVGHLLAFDYPADP
jgi:hypothetical protein